MSLIELRLCGHIIGQHFGENTRRITHVLASKGPQTAPQIALACKLPARLIKEVLFVLVHHSLVLWSLPKEELGQQQQPAIYQLALDKVLLRLALPSFLAHAHAKYGMEVAESLLDIAKFGRCPADLVEKSVYSKLMELGLVEVIDAWSSRADKGDQDSTIPLETAASPKKRKAAVSPKSSKKVKFEDDEAGKPKTFIRLNLKTFVNALWYTQLVQHATRRINQSAGTVLETILGLSGGSSSTSRTPFNSFQVSHRLPAGTSLLFDSEGGGKASTALASYMEAMASDLPYFMKAGDQAGGQFYVDFHQSVQFLRDNAMLALVQARFGQASARIIRILLCKKYLEERSLTKAAMLTGKEARERLFALLQHGFVHLQEVPKTADHAPSRTIYLWTVPQERLTFILAEASKKTLVNLLERIQHERSKYRLLIAKTERSDVAANPAALLSSLERSQLESLNHVLGRLEFQISRAITEYVIFSQLA